LALALPLCLTLAASPPAAADDADFIARMAVEHHDDHPTASPMAEAAPRGAIESAAVVYADLGGVSVSGHFATPAGGEGAAAVVLIHEWWGLNDNIRAVAGRLAGEGYTALAVDLYEGETPDGREGAARLARAARGRTDRVTDNLRQAVAYLQARGAERIGVVGWCFGGGWSLRTALAVPTAIDAAVIYYGRLVTDPAELEPLRAPVLGLFGELDSGIPPETVRAFEAALGELGKPASIHIYPGAGHAFANPSGERYRRAAADDAWAKTLAFFDEHLR